MKNKVKKIMVCVIAMLFTSQFVWSEAETWCEQAMTASGHTISVSTVLSSGKGQLIITSTDEMTSLYSNNWCYKNCIAGQTYDMCTSYITSADGKMITVSFPDDVTSFQMYTPLAVMFKTGTDLSIFNETNGKKLTFGSCGGDTPTPPTPPTPTTGIDWSKISWVQDSNDKFKVGADASLGEQMPDQVVSVQQPGWADKNGIYMTFPSAVSDCSHSCAKDGGGIVLYIDQFTAQETKVTVTFATGSRTFTIFYADGTPATPETPIAVTGVSIPETLTLTEGESSTLTATIAPNDATNKNVTWSIVSGDSYIDINQTGKITGTAVGTAVVRVTTEDGLFTDDCTVTVSEAPEIVNPYCGTEVGHELNPSADQNSFILLSIGSDGEGHTIVNIKQDAAKNTQKFDFINVVGIGTTGGDVTEGGATEMGYKFNTPTADGDGNITLTIQWSTVNWEGRWQALVKLPAAATCASAVIPEAPAAEVKTYYGYLKHEKGVYVGYSITRNEDNTLTFNANIDSETAIVSTQVMVEGTPLTLTKTDDSYSASTTTTFIQDQQLTNTRFYIVLDGAANVAEMPITYTVGSENVKSAIEVAGVSIDPASAAIAVGETTSLTAIIKPAFATNTNISWSVIAGSEYASVDANGVVTGKAAGAATVQVTTESGSKTATCDVNVVAQILLEPNAAPAAPTHPADKVKAIYSPTYNATACNHGAWGGSTSFEKQDVGIKIVLNPGNGYVGFVDFGPLNCSAMESFHADVWVREDASMRFVPIITGQAERGVTKQLVGQQWNSIDISLDEGDWVNTTDWTQVFQLKIDEAAGLTFWINNIYFYTTATEMMYAVSATAGDGGSATASAASVASGTEVTFTATPDCGYEFASWTKGGEVIVGAGATYTTPITEETTLTANFNSTLTPATPTLDAANVMSVYGHYGNQTGLNVAPGWGQVTAYNETTIGGVKMARYTNINYQGLDFNANRMDVSNMQYVHLDLYASVESDIKFSLIWAATEIAVTKHLNGCTIESFDIPLSEFTGADLTTIRQLKFDAQNLPLAGKTLIVQNIYFYAPNEFTLSEEEDNAENLTTFNGKVCDVTIARTFEADKLYTLALPFDMTEAQVEETFGTCTMYALAESYWKVEGENMYIRFAPVTEFKANTPILFTPTETIENVVAKDVTIKNGDCETATNLVTFHGTYSKKNLTASNYILAADQYLYPVVGDEYSINGMRGYFSFGSVSKAPKMARIILHEEITTDNAFLRNEKQEMRAKKVLENGRFVIIRDGARYGVLGVEE